SAADAPIVSSLEVTPARRLGAKDFRQQLQVVAKYSDGVSRDVTAQAKYIAMDQSIARVDFGGEMHAVASGQAPVLVRFEGQAAISLVVVPRDGGAANVDLTGFDPNHVVDKFAAAKFREQGVQPSAVCDDAAFVRRAHLDAVGSLPTAAEAAAFIDSTDPGKRAKLVDRLLGLTGDPALDVYNNQYASYWTLKWADLLRVNSQTIGDQGMWAMHNWLKDSFRANKPFDRFVRELVTAKGSTFSVGPANFFRSANNPNDQAEQLAQVFLGVRLQCAKCHHHPYERMSLDEYYHFSAFFARVGLKTTQEFGVFGGLDQVLLVRNGGEVYHPKKGKLMPPKPLHVQEWLPDQVVQSTLDRRTLLADWIASPGNPYFAVNIANRYVAYLMGRGVVEPVDDVRATNPPSNPELLNALAEEFKQAGYDVKKLMRRIMTSRLYQLSSDPTPANAFDSVHYSHYTVKRLNAEVFLDAVDAVTGVPTKFDKLPLGTRAVDLPDASYNNYFLNTFGKPGRQTVCECERA
ncbi:MAG: DUF1549 domain-containing protein, partial [Planctomycetia bacterium]